MTRSWVLRSRLWVPEPPAAVFPFFADAQNLQQLTPSWLSFRILTPLPIPMHEGTRIDYRLRIRGVPVRWRTRIAHFDPPFEFADEQESGPYKRWCHRHTFLPRDGGTELSDRVELIPPGGPLAPLVFRLFVRDDVQRIFDFRLRAMAERFCGNAADGRVWFEPAGAGQDISMPRCSV